ncbi:MAG: M20/M25/M40 family metallo-hydrolase [Pseudomonadota bacterium]
MRVMPNKLFAAAVITALFIWADVAYSQVANANGNAPAHHPNQGSSAFQAAPERLIEDIARHSSLMQNLEEMCDGIGPRMTGSAQLRTAQAWAMEKLKEYGATNVHEEAYELGKPWQRGSARARLLNANGQSVDIVQKAWTTGTDGPIQADVAVLDVNTLDELKVAAPKLKGKIVLLVSSPTASSEQGKNMRQFANEVNQVIKDAQFAAILIISRKEGKLQDMLGGPNSRFDRNAGIITKESAKLLRRLLARGLHPRLELELGGGFGAQPVQAYNVVADFKGSELADEMVIVGAHQDSWDLGTGATDNGTGTVVAMEMMRTMHALGLKPRRSLRVVLFSGEEQGLLGSKAYLAQHHAELEKIQAVFVMDAGSGRILGFPDMKVEAWYTALSAALAPAKQLGALDVPYAIGAGSDHDVFFDRGIPAFTPMQEPLDYRSHTQHSQADTLDHVVIADLLQGAQVMAVTVWGVLNGEPIAHQVRAPH